MEPIFRTLEIEGFRAFRRLKIDGLGRVNLVTGRNNTGKSSLLEAVRLLAFGGSASILSTLLMDREMDLTEDEDGGGPSENAVFVQSLFHGFPQSVGGRGPHLEIFASGNRQAIRIRVAQALYYEERGADGTRRLTPSRWICSDGKMVYPSWKSTLVKTGARSLSALCAALPDVMASRQRNHVCPVSM